MNERLIIENILNGDANAYRYFVERYQTGLIIYCDQLVKSRHDAEDIAQEAFVKAYDNLADYNPNKAKFSTWLYRIAANTAIDFLRRNKKIVASEDMDLFSTNELSDSLYSDEIASLRNAVEHLEPPKFAELIKAYYWHGESYQELALRYGTSTNTIGTWMRRAKLQLKEVLS